MKKKIMSLKSWSNELRYQKSNVVWVCKFNTEHVLWSKLPKIDKNGNLIMVNNTEKAIEYYNWIRENKQELLEL